MKILQKMTIFALSFGKMDDDIEESYHAFSRKRIYVGSHSL